MHLVCSIAAFVAWTVAPPLGAQVTTGADAEARAAPGGAVVFSLRAGAKVSPGVTKGAETLVSVDGWVRQALVGGKRDTFPASISGKSAVRLRSSPSPQGAILGELRPGVGVTTLSKQGTWAHVKRSGWIPSSALPRQVAHAPAAQRSGSAPKPDAAAAAALETASPGPPGSMSASRATKVLASPGGKTLGELAPGAVVRPLARDRGWMRVTIEGWVNERDLAPADSSFASALTAADLRADPEGTRGKVVRWEVQVLSLQAADPLRRELTPDEPYLLARGPGAENALLYLAVPPSLLTEVKTIPPLTIAIITARVRSGRSEPAGTPILDLRTISKR